MAEKLPHAGDPPLGRPRVGGEEQQVVGIAEGAHTVLARPGQGVQRRVEGVQVEIAQQRRQAAALDQAAGAPAPETADGRAAGLEQRLQQQQQGGVADPPAQLVEEQTVIDFVETVGYVEVDGLGEHRGRAEATVSKRVASASAAATDRPGRKPKLQGRKSGSRTGSRTCLSAAWTTRSRTVSTPMRRTASGLPGLGISMVRGGEGR